MANNSKMVRVGNGMFNPDSVLKRFKNAEEFAKAFISMKDEDGNPLHSANMLTEFYNSISSKPTKAEKPTT